MANEIDSFVVKFKYLLDAGFKASLKLSSCDGEVIVNLEANLGCTAGSGTQPPVTGFQSPKMRGFRNRGPSYRRRQEQRNLRHLHAKEYNNEDNVEELVTAEKAGDNIIENCPAVAVENSDSNAESVMCEDVEHLDAEKATILFSDVVNEDIHEIDDLEVHDVVQSSQSKDNVKHIQVKEESYSKVNGSGIRNQMELLKYVALA